MVNTKEKTTQRSLTSKVIKKSFEKIFFAPHNQLAINKAQLKLFRSKQKETISLSFEYVGIQLLSGAIKKASSK